MAKLQTRREAVAGLLAGAAGLALGRPGRAAEMPVLRIGMVQGMFRDVQPALVHAMAMPLRAILSRQTGLDGKIDILPGPFAQAEKLLNGELQLGVFHGFEYAWVSQLYPELKALLIAAPAGRRGPTTVSASVVVRAESELKSLADLTADPVTIPRGARAHALLFLERERAKLPTGAAKSKTVLSMTPEDALDALALGDVPAVLVDGAALEGYGALQPGAVKQLRKLAESRPFPPAAVVTKKGAMTADMLARVKGGLATAHTTTAGKPLMALWNLRGFEELPEGYEDLVAEVRKDYPLPEAAARK